MMSDGNPREWFRSWIEWLLATLDRIRDIQSNIDPVRFGTRYQTIVVPNLGSMNRNGRVYTREMAEEMCGMLDPERTVGQIGFPDAWDVSLNMSSHRIHKVFIVGNDLWMEYSVLNTPQGRLLYDLFQNVGRDGFVFRPRGSGVVDKDCRITNYKLFSFDMIPVEEDACRPYNDADVMKKGMEVFEHEGDLNEWLSEPNEMFGGDAPRELMNVGQHDQVMRELGRIEHGIY